MKAEAGTVSHAGPLEKGAFQFCSVVFLTAIYRMPTRCLGVLLPILTASLQGGYLCSTPVSGGFYRILSDFSPEATKLVKWQSGVENLGVSNVRALTFFHLVL